jgi:hypothetical protein
LPIDDDDDKKDDDDEEVIFVEPPNNNDGPIRLLSENEGSFSAMVKNLFPELFEKLSQNKNIVISDDNDIFKQKIPSLYDPNPMQGVLLTPAEKYGLTMSQQSGLPFSQPEEKSNFMGISGARRAGLFDDDDDDDFKQSREISQNRRINVPETPSYSGVGLLSSEESFNPLSASSYGVDIDETPVFGVDVPIDVDEKQGGEDIDIDEGDFEELTGIKESHLNKMSKNALIQIARKHGLIPDEEAPRLTKKDIVKKIIGDGNDSAKQYLKILKYLAVTKSAEIATRRGSIPSARFQEDEITRLMG